MMCLILLLCAPLSSCSGEEEKIEEQIEIELGGETFTVEVARTEEQRRKGLMHRSSIGKNEGMLFVFERDQQLSFWMKNTEIPLSIAYISSDGTVREIYDLTPHSERAVESNYAVRYALELPRGAFDRVGIGPGDSIPLPEDL
ncbi:MAG: DUF192 domain-containing protein [Spirochaetia bacterium]